MLRYLVSFASLFIAIRLSNTLPVDVAGSPALLAPATWTAPTTLPPVNDPLPSLSRYRLALGSVGSNVAALKEPSPTANDVKMVSIDETESTFKRSNENDTSRLHSMIRKEASPQTRVPRIIQTGTIADRDYAFFDNATVQIGKSLLFPRQGVLSGLLPDRTFTGLFLDGLHVGSAKVSYPVEFMPMLVGLKLLT
jgi:hypothetical protein